MNHYQVIYQLLKSDGTPNGIPNKFPICAKDEKEAIERCLL